MDLPPSIEVETFKGMSFEGMLLPMIAVYDSPLDMPYKFVARLLDLNHPTSYCVIRDSLKEIKEILPESSFLMGRSPQDEPHIVGTWIVISDQTRRPTNEKS